MLCVSFLCDYYMHTHQTVSAGGVLQGGVRGTVPHPAAIWRTAAHGDPGTVPLRTHALGAPASNEAAREYGAAMVPFWDRAPVLGDLVELLLRQMEEVEVDKFAAAQRPFMNSDGLRDASASCGVVFAEGTAVSSIGTRIENQRDINLTKRVCARAALADARGDDGQILQLRAPSTWETRGRTS